MASLAIFVDAGAGLSAAAASTAPYLEWIALKLPREELRG